jgi:GT2 family glycosyltransferase
MRIVAILTSHNRRIKTLACLRSYFDQALPTPTSLEAVLVDDGSTDGTAEAVQALGAPVTIVCGAGDLYWARGMARAEKDALRRAPDYLLWLNDDVALDRDAVARLLDVAKTDDSPCVVVGAVRDPFTGETTYSGLRRRDYHPLRYERVEPADQPQTVETFHGNVVLVPIAVAVSIGGIDGKFAHGAADYDYGLRATKAGVINLLAPETVGTCSSDSPHQPWLDPSLPFRERLRFLLGPKGLPPKSFARYLRRHGGRAWLVFWLALYVKFALVSLQKAVARSLRRLRQVRR